MFSYADIKRHLFKLDAEQAHNLLHAVGKYCQYTRLPLLAMESRFAVRSPALRTEVYGMSFANPLGLAAGFDKNADIVDFMAALGFGFIEVGSVTNLLSNGNPKPRLFRLAEDEALINRMGLNNKGPDVVLANIMQRRSSVPLGVNIAKSNRPDLIGLAAEEDMVLCYERIAHVADYTVLNVSCPNTEDGKTFEEPESLRRLLESVSKRRERLSRRVPLFVKFSSDLSEQSMMRAVEVCEGEGADGYILVNTSLDRSFLKTEATVLAGIGPGGLSGKPLVEKSKKKVREVFRKIEGRKPIIGVGGVDSAQAAYELIRAGASLVQCYTGLVYRGPGLVREMNKGLLSLLERDGLLNIREAVGRDA